MIEWLPISDAPKDGSALRFRFSSGEEFNGRWGPYWCGSDCPCDVAGEGAPDMEPPDCWCAYREGSAHGENQTPEFYIPLTQSPMEREK